MSSIVERVAVRYSRHVAARSLAANWAVLALAGMLAAAGIAAFAAKASVDSRVETLLPNGTETQAALDSARQRFPSASPLFLVVQSSDPVANARIARELNARLQDHDAFSWSITRRDPTFFLDHRLLYVPTDALETLAEEIDLYVEWHRCDANPFCIALEDEPPIPNAAHAQQAFTEESEAAPLLRLFGIDEMPDPDADELAASEADLETPDGRRLGDLCNAGGDVCVVQAALVGDASDLAFASGLHAELTQMLSEYRAGGVHGEAAPDDLSLHIRGRVDSLVRNQDTLKDDLKRTAALSSFLVLIVLLVQFRGARALVLLVAPLLVGAGATALFVAFVTPVLNLISAATLAVLAGLGIDFGLHLLTHYSHLRNKGQGVREALETTFRSLLPSILTAGLTTAAGFGALASGVFPGFVQMGVVAGVGIVATLFAYLWVFPPMVLVMDAIRHERRSLARPWPIPDWLKRPFPIRVAYGLVALGVVGLGAGVWALPSLELETNYGRLNVSAAPGEAVDYGSALHGTSRSPVLMMGDSPAELDEAVSGLVERYPSGPFEPVEGAWLLAPSMFLPAEQEARLALVTRMRESLAPILPRLSGDEAEAVHRWQPLLAIQEPITGESLPPWAKSVLSEADGTFGTIGLVYVPLDSQNTDHMELLVAEIQDWRVSFDGVQFASFGALLGEVSALVRDEAPQIVWIAALGLILITLLAGRSWRRSVMALTPVALSSVAAVLVMVLFDLHVNLYNLLMFPVAFGIAVDGAVYLVWSIQKPSDFTTFPIVGRAILGSALTTMGAFGSMLISHNPGLASLGQLAVITLSATIFANLVWLPAVLSWRLRKR